MRQRLLWSAATLVATWTLGIAARADVVDRTTLDDAHILAGLSPVSDPPHFLRGLYVPTGVPIPPPAQLMQGSYVPSGPPGAQPFPGASAGTTPNPCNGIPTIAASANYCTLTYEIDGTNNEFTTSTVDTGCTLNAGYKLGCYNWFASAPFFGNSAITGGGSNLKVGQGGNTFNGTLSSAWLNAAGNNFHGTAFGSGMYVIYSGGFNLPASPGSIAGGWPAMWSDPLEHELSSISGNTSMLWLGQSVSPLFAHWVEPDVVENFLGFYSSNVNQISSTSHDDWGINTGVTPPSCFGGGYCGVSTQGVVNISSLSNAIHRYEMLWTPATCAAQGHLTYFVDEVQTIDNPYTKYSFTLAANGAISSSSPTITMSGPLPCSTVVSGYDVFDQTKGVDLGLFSSMTSNTLTLQANALANGTGTTDVLVFTPQPPPGNTTTGACTAPWCMGVVDNQHLLLILGSGGGASGGVNVYYVNLQYVRVYQASAAGNLTN